ncbi:MAG: glycosyltransferase [Chloroflexi bacterium]|nr:glycosyltransferase [Chloroflexota bacterium]
MIQILSAFYLLTAAGLSLYGFLGLLTLWLYWRHRHESFPPPTVAEADLPPVTVQLPIFNERYVVERLVETAVTLQYPANRLQIQVIDDSSDDTTQKAAELVERYHRQGVNIHLLHRDNREGYKAGALAAALPQASGDFVAIFDADFQPQPNFLQQTIPHFLNEPDLGMVQARWGHLNDGRSALTAAQAIALDKHFAMEQTVRHRADMFPKFNGSGGVWRRSCIEQAGGWRADTVCEDLCLSTRATLIGCQFRFLNDVAAPAELPTSMTAYKSQQARWAKGSMQCLRIYGRSILTDRNHTLLGRLYALLSMSAYATHLLLIALLLLLVPLIYADYTFSANMFIFSLAGIGQPLLFILGQKVLYPDWRRRLRHFPTLLLVAIGTAPSNSRAILQAMYGRRHTFVRTPKTGDKKDAAYSLRFDRIVFGEMALALYAILGLALALARGNFGPIFFLAASALGFGYVAFLSLRD